MKKGFLFILIISSLFLQAQKKMQHSCMDEVTSSLYNWKDIENKFIKQLNISTAESKAFFKYAAKYDYLKVKDYYAQVKEGAITKANAQQFWLNKLPYLKDVYQFKYLLFNEKEKQELERNNATIEKTSSASCNNLDFSSGTLTDWVGEWNNQGTSGTTNNGGTSQGYGNLTVNGFNSSGFNSVGYVHELCNGGVDPNVPINRVAPSHSYSLRLGNDSASRVEENGSQNPLPFNHQIISNTFSVTASSLTITYWYAVVLTQFNPNNHLANNQPYFKIRMYDGSGNEIVCARYDVDALSAPSIGGFNTIEVQVPDNNGGFSPYDFFYKDWSPVFIPLNAYLGQNVTITFETSDCAGGGHSGYAYVAVDCAPQTVIVDLPQPCIGGNTTLTAPAGLATYNWSGPNIVSGNNSQVATVNAGGTYSVSMTTFANIGQTGCALTLTTNIANSTISPAASFSATSACLHTNTLFTDESTLLPNQGTLTAWHWDFGDGGVSSSNNPAYMYGMPGTYPVNYTITSSVGCTATYSAMVTVNPLPTASFIADTVCKGGATTFSNTSTGGSSYNWSFGDNSGNSTVQNPTHTYANSGNFVATLTVTNTFSCKASATTNVLVNPNAVANFSTPTVCFGSNSVFTNSSTPTTGVNYSWHFGDASNPADTSNVQSPTYIYPSAGTYSITLNITSTSGCIASKTETVAIKPIPAITVASPSLFCWNDIIQPPTVNNVPVGSNPTYAWTNNNTLIGLNGSGNGIPPIFTAALNNTGANITGTISITPHLNGCVGLPKTYSITIKPTPVVTQPSLNYCPGDVVPALTFTATPAAATPNITWTTVNSPYIGLSQTSGGTTLPSFHAISNVTNAESNVIILNDNLNGCVGPTTTFSILINSNPTAAFTYINACDGNPTTFIDQSISNSGTIAQWNWNFGTGTSTGHTTNYVLNPAGTYTVSLQVTSDKGCKDSITQPVIVLPSPIVSFGANPTVGCTPFTATFIDTVGQNSPPIQSWNWNFGNGANTTYTTNTFTSLNYTNTSHTQSNFYNVSLSVMAVNGCITTVTKNNYIQVYPKPLAGFTYNPKYADIIDPTIHFVNQSIGASGPNAFNWNFGDTYELVDSLSDSNIGSPTHVYSDQAATNYTVTQTVENIFGCIDSTKEIIVIHEAVTFYIPSAFSPNGDLKNEGFKGTGIGIDNKTYNLWIFDRWGLLLFHATDLETAWDGHYHGAPVQEDVYVWRVSFEDDLAQAHEYHGTVTLIK